MGKRLVPKTTSTEKMVDLANLSVDDIDFESMAEHLSKLARYDGATPGVFYSVAQHSCLAHDIAIALGEEDAAPFCLLHDGHEYLFGDVTKPTVWLLEHVNQTTDSKYIQGVFDKAKENLDEVIFNAAGVEYDVPEHASMSKYIDAMLLTLERRELMPLSANEGWESSVPVPKEAEVVTPIRPLSPLDAKREFLERFSNIPKTVNHLPRILWPNTKVNIDVPVRTAVVDIG